MSQPSEPQPQFQAPPSQAPVPQAQPRPQPGQNIDVNRYLPAKPMVINQGGNRNAKNLPSDAAGRDWSNGLFECGNDMNTCVVSCCCPCITYGRNRARMDYLNEHGQVLQDPEPINNDCLVFGALHCFTGIGGWALALFNRGHVRHRYGIKGDIVMDGLTMWCCSPCAVTQESQEIALEEQSLVTAYQKQQPE